jgi:hypothetical protein
MDITYKIRAADGKEYGPVTLDQLKGWLRESRVSPQNEVMRSDTDYWVAAGEFAELKDSIPATAAPPPLPASGGITASGLQDAGLMAEVVGGASWFYWVAGLSVVNSLLSFFNAGIRMLFGLGITQVTDSLGQGLEGGGRVVSLIVAFVTAGVLVLFGVLGTKRQTWAFAVGVTLYALDMALVLLFGMWLEAAFHGYVLFRLIRGTIACSKLNRQRG